MTTNPNFNNPPALNDTDAIYEEMCFAPIDTIVNWRMQRFPFTMLKVGRILLKQSETILEVRAARISRIMAKHRTEMFGIYTPGQICEEVHGFGGEIVGGGIRIEWNEIGRKRLRSTPRYDFNFSRIYKPEDMVVKNHQPLNAVTSQPAITQ